VLITKQKGAIWYRLKAFFPELFNGTEFGVYYQTLHDHTPMLSSHYDSEQIFLDYAEDIEQMGVSFNTNIVS